MSRKLLVGIAALAMVALIVAACGGDGQALDTSEASEDEASQVLTETNDYEEEEGHVHNVDDVHEDEAQVLADTHAHEEEEDNGHLHEVGSEEHATELTLVTTEWAFTPNTLEVKVDEPVIIVLVNDGIIRHQVDIPAFGFYLPAEAGTTATGVLIPDKVGTFELACEIQGHKEAGMVGTLIVTS